MPRAPQPLRLRPIGATMDSRSMPELVSQAHWRMLQNVSMVDPEKPCRAPGWKKLLDGYFTHRDYNNEDLHDQLLSLQIYYDTLTDVDDSTVRVFPPDNPDFATYCGTTKRTRTQGRQPITFGAEIVSSRETRHWLAGTQSRLYHLNFRGGNWEILADGLGGSNSNPEIRLRHASIGDVVLFTNDWDEPFYWIIGSGPTGCAMQSVQNIPELQEIGVTKAACVATFKGTVFWGNVEQDGERRTNRLIWSSYVAPFEYVEDPGVSTAGTTDLDFGERIIEMKELGDALFIYTDQAIWQVVVVGGDVVFQFVRRYRSSKRDKCVVYPFTLVAAGNGHLYMSGDAIYEWNNYIAEPTKVGWIHMASNILYDRLNKSACAIHTAGFDPATRQAWFSCALDSDKLPSITLVVNTDYGKCHKVDHGFTMFFAGVPDSRMSIRDWLLENCICTEAELNSGEMQAIGFQMPKAGAGTGVNPACTSYIGSVVSNVELVVGGVTTEDWNATPADDSLCTLFGDQSVADGCVDCENAVMFLSASATDYALKQMGEVYYRERFEHATFSEGGTVTYVLDGYDSIMLKGPMNFGSEGNKNMTGVRLEFDAADQTVPSQMALRIGASNKADDPLKTCGIQWYEEDPRDIACLDDDKAMEWMVAAIDAYLYVEFKISGTGGASCYSSLQLTLGQDSC